ncbi:Rieske (2Fe-2S) protein [Roseateles koreensis]|uniref:Rieske (2Fe-2S) protein n=1 Tax=Roseateles koreensis TaxID=2987526 RepID=A0ABT5KQL5_9BURK|nr:Rieske (2Fe-2S) protein [Roseateles koreensis]MDC8784658.1 Rieske (2Fe-2S) protein [Roseateles koreensis]
MRICHLEDLPDGESCGFDPRGTGRDTVLIVRQGARLYAWENACPHHGTPMAWRKDAYLNAARDRIVCFAHGAEFEIDTGSCTLGPCLGQSLTPVPLNLHQDGEVYLAQPYPRRQS